MLLLMPINISKHLTDVRAHVMEYVRQIVQSEHSTQIDTVIKPVVIEQTAKDAQDKLGLVAIAGQRVDGVANFVCHLFPADHGTSVGRREAEALGHCWRAGRRQLLRRERFAPLLNAVESAIEKNRAPGQTVHY
ncbi:hypothetical protein BpHYR1_002959 [Brachionus plicatilis]|uniref:Uncharacterized protein n=1 Tax=Brachionus plicatilis TaxID=10195 RepID=A0A3M7SGW4_BRAPC|nr:hypothetical protein BpHYR1_002959 [Brachionus plicatilis]